VYRKTCSTGERRSAGHCPEASVVRPLPAPSGAPVADVGATRTGDVRRSCTRTCARSARGHVRDHVRVLIGQKDAHLSVTSRATRQRTSPRSVAPPPPHGLHTRHTDVNDPEQHRTQIADGDQGRSRLCAGCLPNSAGDQGRHRTPPHMSRAFGRKLL
jgi:hypothetical protein